MSFSTLNVTSTGTGSITADGTGGAGGGSGIELFTNAGFTTNSGNISLTGAGVSPDEGLDMTDVSAFVNSTSGDITITANTIDLAGSTASSGALTIQPNTVAGTIGLGTGSTGTLNLTDAELGNITNGFSSITFGRTDGTGAVDMRAFTYLDPIIVYGSTITTNGAIAAGANDVTFNVGPASAGTLNLDFSVTTTGTFSINGGASNDDFNINVTGQTATLNGNGGTNTLSGPDVVNSWTITADDAGTQNSITFSNIQNLQGGTVNDTFTFNGAFQISGSIDGIAGTNTIVGPNVINAWSITSNNAGTITPTGALGATAFSNIQNAIGGTSNDTFTFTGNFQLTGTTGIDGGAGDNTIVGPDLATDWQVTSTDEGTLDPGVGTTSFTNIQNLTGGSNTDDFVFADGQGLTGAINGGAPAATNTLDYSAFTTTATINLITSTSGTASNLGGGFTNIANFIGNVNVIGPPTPPTPTPTTVDFVKFNSLDTQLFLTLHEVRRFRLIEEFAWLQFNDPILWLIDKETTQPLILDDKNNVLY